MASCSTPSWIILAGSTSATVKMGFGATPTSKDIATNTFRSPKSSEGRSRCSEPSAIRCWPHAVRSPLDGVHMTASTRTLSSLQELTQARVPAEPRPEHALLKLLRYVQKHKKHAAL